MTIFTVSALDIQKILRKTVIEEVLKQDFKAYKTTREKQQVIEIDIKTIQENIECLNCHLAYIPLSNFKYSSAQLHGYTHDYAFTYSFNLVISTTYRSIEKVICCLLK